MHQMLETQKKETVYSSVISIHSSCKNLGKKKKSEKTELEIG